MMIVVFTLIATYDGNGTSTISRHSHITVREHTVPLCRRYHIRLNKSVIEGFIYKSRLPYSNRYALAFMFFL
jgi:hypothetical protein